MCTGCHAEEARSWSGSQHQVAMQTANDQTVLAPFRGESMREPGVNSSFSRRDGAFQVRTSDVDGALKDFAVRYTFGVAPLQQYLVELPRGRLQALGLSWDTRPAQEGGQRWLDLYPASAPGAKDPSHWTDLDHNWNYMCADCHATNLRKNYDAASDTYHTTWSEIGVGCEACHGPASNHVDWAKHTPQSRTDPSKGLVIRLDERRGVTWTRDAQTGQPRRNGPLTTPHELAARELDVCARCHSRRSQFTDAVTAADPIAQGFHVALIEPGLYFPDGQMRDEVYNIGSFMQSRMHSAGVVCSDCHDPHSQKLRVPGDGVCLQCHDGSRYAATSHHMHAAESSGARCAACHMPVQTYMQIDQRHDHSLRIPQPAASARIGAPDACTGCHRNRSAAWAEQVIARSHPQRATPFQTFGPAFAALQSGKAGAADAVEALFRDKAQPEIVRASAIQLLADAGATMQPADLASAVHDPSPMVRAAGALAANGDANLLGPLLGDPLLSVRIAAVTGLMQSGDATSSALAGPAFERAKGEYLQALRFNADRPESRTSLGQTLAAAGDTAGAITAYQGAISLDRAYTAAYVGMADTYRRLGDEAKAEKSLRDARAFGRDQQGAVMLALGLLQYRQGNKVDALASLAEATRIEPDNVEILYTYAVALHDLGKPAESLRLIAKALARHPDDASLRQLQSAYAQERR